MFSLSSSRSFLFLRVKIIFATHAARAVATEKAAEELSARM
jgi:hypothetical protein